MLEALTGRKKYKIYPFTVIRLLIYIIIMFRVLVIRFIGFCLTPIPILLNLIWLLAVFPFSRKAKLFVQPRRHPPKILGDKRWGEHKYIKLSNGIKMHYVEKGDSTRPLMVFLHGFPEFWFCWRHQIEYFSQQYW